jgi:hypothetical protein
MVKTASARSTFLSLEADDFLDPQAGDDQHTQQREVGESPQAHRGPQLPSCQQ